MSDPASPAATTSLARFAAKTAIVTAAIVAGLVLTVALVSDIAVTRASQIGNAFDLKKIERELERAADPKNDFPPEQKERLIRSVRAIVTRLQPVTSELAPLFCAPTR